MPEAMIRSPEYQAIAHLRTEALTRASCTRWTNHPTPPEPERRPPAAQAKLGLARWQ
jgi:hypothetical protein